MAFCRESPNHGEIAAFICEETHGWIYWELSVKTVSWAMVSAA